jgi:alpha-D-xyloside xylohydrolase
MVRPNTVLPVGANENRPDYDYADGVVYHVFAWDGGVVATASVPALDGSVGATVEARRTGSRIEVSVQGSTGPWSVLLRGIETVASVAGGTAQADGLGVRVVPDAGTRSVTVRLAESV